MEAHHHWLRRRALNLESSCYDPATGQVTDQKQLALYLRYQTTHDRGFHKALNDLLKLKAVKRKEQIGFESQKRVQEKHDMKKEGTNGTCSSPQAKIDYEQNPGWDHELKEIEASLARDRQKPEPRRSR